MSKKKIDVDALRERAFRMAQSGLISARQLASDIEQLHEYDGAGGWRSAKRPDGSPFETFREYAAYRNPPGLGFNEADGAASVDAIVNRLIQFDRNRPAIKYLGGSVRGTPSEARKGKRYAAKEKSEAGACPTISKAHHSSVAGLADRLQRDFPKVWAAYQNGEHRTVNAAARAAGIVPDRHNPVNEARQAWNRMTKAQRKKFREMVKAAGLGSIKKGLVTA
jgi:hypothetical protein